MNDWLITNAEKIPKTAQIKTSHQNLDLHPIQCATMPDVLIAITFPFAL